jgi:hypothetical protein
MLRGFLYRDLEYSSTNKVLLGGIVGRGWCPQLLYVPAHGVAGT